MPTSYEVDNIRITCDGFAIWYSDAPLTEKAAPVARRQESVHGGETWLYHDWFLREENGTKKRTQALFGSRKDVMEYMAFRVNKHGVKDDDDATS